MGLGGVGWGWVGLGGVGWGWGGVGWGWVGLGGVGWGWVGLGGVGWGWVGLGGLVLFIPILPEGFDDEIHFQLIFISYLTFCMSTHPDISHFFHTHPPSLPLEICF